MLSGFVCRPIGWPSTKNQQHVSLNWHLDQQTQMFAKKEKKNPTHSFFIIHLPLWTVRLKHTSKCRRALGFFGFFFGFFFTCNSPHHGYYLWSPGLSSIHECIQSTQHIRLRLGCFWLRSVSWHPVWSEVPSSLLISAERSPIHPSIWRIACGTF